MSKESLKDRVKGLKTDVHALFLACKEPGVPWYAKALMALIIGYVICPIDLIPDFIPVLGELDDLIIVPMGIAVVVKMIPKAVMEDCRRRGLGTRLVGAVERMSLERGFKRLTLMVEPDNKPAICLYSKLGFTVFKDSSELWRGKPLATLCMSKSLILNRNRCTANHASRRRLRRLGTVTRP